MQSKVIMPHYDYCCTSCGYQEEVFQKISEEPLKTCPSCRQNNFQRQPGGGVGLHFKGTGFYITDYPASSPSDQSCPCGKNSSCSSEPKN
ncbi:hypothetical protein DB44_AL00080 [Candidatus Protochlamydia amoebophila]|uniref:Putative regulatory protein FmdB zinc ribbon domain-containing protein n=2 Tax=Candidatus Protochlamydia amoebophila TaxID=362787 RepID=A0A0C1HAC8_9BACT|nr:hypothetical protein DB44_AL00080 [Candidatus Protochlamydia amoebophila]